MAPAQQYSVVGPPGCGKTTAIKHYLEQAADQYGADRLAVASLTRAAVAEIVGRNIPVPDGQARTLHGLAYGALGSPTIATGRSAIADWNLYCDDHGHPRLILPVPADPKDIDGDDEEDDDAAGWLGMIQHHRSTMLPVELWPAEEQGAYALWCAWKEERGWLDFPDLLEQAAERTTWAPGAPEVLCIDEFQDLDRLGMRLVNHWAQEMRYVVRVGDPDQCLYEWRGSDPNMLHEGNSELRTLKQSYRVPIAVHEAAVRWIEQMPGRVPIEYLPTEEPGVVEDEPGMRSKSPWSVADLAEEYAAEGSVMILGQSRWAIDPVIRELRRRGVPFHNPYKTRNGRWNPLGSRRRGATLTSDRLLAYCAPNTSVLRRTGRAWRGRDVALFAPMLRAEGIIRRGGKARLTALADEADWPQVVSVLQESIEEESLIALLGADPDWLAAHVVGDYADRLSYPTRVLEEYGARALETEPAIIIGTIHSVKGGEADTVLLLPDLTPAAFDDFEDGEGASVRRLFYVGMTRAKRRLVLGGSNPRQYAVQWF